MNTISTSESETGPRCPGSPSSMLAPIAYHEAGHVVVGHLLGLQLLDTDILPDDEGGRGHTHFAHPGSWFQPQRGRLDARERDLIERVLTTFMAGFAAESRHGEADVEGSGYDLDQSLREWVGYVAGTPHGREAALRGFLERAVSIVEGSQAWAAIEAVAAALLAEEQLSGSAAAQIAQQYSGHSVGGLGGSIHLLERGPLGPSEKQEVLDARRAFSRRGREDRDLGSTRPG